MRTLTFLAPVLFSAPTEAGSDVPTTSAPTTAPVTDIATAAVAASNKHAAKRTKLNRPASNPKPLNEAAPAKPASKPAKLTKPVAVKPDAKPVAAKPSAHITRTAATVARGACNFGGTLSDRDTAYLTFYAGFAKRATGGRVTVAMLGADLTKRPAYSGSSKPHDAGVIQRLAKADLLNVAADGASFTFTKRAVTLAAYVAG